MTTSTELTPENRRPLTPLSAERFASLRSQLANGLNQHRAQLEREEALVAGLTDDDGDDAPGRDRELAQLSVALARESLDEFERAMARVDTNTYGTCEACGLTIPFERLEAIPQTRVCVACA